MSSINVDAIDGSVLNALASKIARTGVVSTHTGAGGNVNFTTSSGAPTGPALKGTLCVDTTNAKLYICTVAAGTWVVVGTQV